MRCFFNKRNFIAIEKDARFANQNNNKTKKIQENIVSVFSLYVIVEFKRKQHFDLTALQKQKKTLRGYYGCRCNPQNIFFLIHHSCINFSLHLSSPERLFRFQTN